MMKFFLLCLLALFAMLAPPSAVRAAGKPFVSAMFSDNMVLQRDRAIPVWGWADPGTKVTVALSDKHTETQADKNGKWTASLPSFKAGGPYTMMIAGPQSVTFKNILIGDVWICSGQSNMEFGIGNGIDAEKEIAAADYPEIRLFTVVKHVAIEPQDTLNGTWDVCTPKTVSSGGWNGFTAVGYFFGRALYKELHVPIGLIHTSWGGTPAEAWTSGDALKVMPEYRPMIAKLDDLRSGHAESEVSLPVKMAQWWTKNDPGSADTGGWADPNLDTSTWKTMALPSLWEDAGLPGFDGIVWFRKEIDLPESAVDKPLVLHLGPIDDRDTTWVNGVKVGGMDLYNDMRNYTIPAGTMKAGRNVIAVRVLDTGGGGGLYGTPGQLSLDVPGGEAISLAGSWLYKASTALGKATTIPGQVNQDQNYPTTLYNGMIAPVIPYGIKGALWYQGESNSWKAYQYRTLLPTMITDWRTRWHEGNFPFYIVQLANFEAVNKQPVTDGWAELREAQSMTARNLPHTGIAVTVDIGDAKDIHPKNKQEVGRRLALAALAGAYGKKIEYSGPAYKSMKIDGSTATLTFDHTTGGMIAKGGGKLMGFSIAGEDKHFVWADAVIKGNTIEVSAVGLDKPAAVRYAWSINPVCNLYNGAGLPASPFRTDTWPGITVNNK